MLGSRFSQFDPYVTLGRAFLSSLGTARELFAGAIGFCKNPYGFSLDVNFW
jgi:hypothetical protein